MGDGPVQALARHLRRAEFKARFWEVFSHQDKLFRLDLLTDGAEEVLACGSQIVG